MLPPKPTAVDRTISALAWHEAQGCHGPSIFPGPGRSQRIRFGWNKGHKMINTWNLGSSITLPPPCLLLRMSCYKNKMKSPVTKQLERRKAKKNSQEPWIKLWKLFSAPFFICDVPLASHVIECTDSCPIPSFRSVLYSIRHQVHDFDHRFSVK